MMRLPEPGTVEVVVWAVMSLLFTVAVILTVRDATVLLRLM